VEKNGKPGWILQLRDDDDSLMREPMNRYVGGGLRMSIPIEPRPIVERESLITRMKNKLKLI
jgi:hypothetical protein